MLINILWCASLYVPQVQRDFEELPAGAALSLRDSLVSLLVQHCQVRGLLHAVARCLAPAAWRLVLSY